MAKKKKRPQSDYQQPGVKSAPAKKARTDRDTDLADTPDGAAAGSAGGVATRERVGRRSKSSETSTSGNRGSGRSKAKGSKNTAPAKAGLSGNQQWMIVIGLATLVLVGGVIWSVLRQTGGSGENTVTGWDLPARSSETRNGD